MLNSNFSYNKASSFGGAMRVTGRNYIAHSVVYYKIEAFQSFVLLISLLLLLLLLIDQQ